MARDDSARHQAVTASQFAHLVQAGVDRSTIDTWDESLARPTRILVPMDVQAYVVPTGGGEPTVAVTGGPGDPPPFDPGAPRRAGVHVHWAIPDALLAGRLDPQTGTLVMPALPDRWVVLRTLQSTGGRQAHLRGWVVDARTASVSPLETFTGTAPPAPAGTPVLYELDGASGGSLLWTASYQASVGRFGLHDPLTDLSPGPAGADHAVYTVAGWWSDLAADPLVAGGPAELNARLAARGWLLAGEDAEDMPSAERSWPAKLRQMAGLVEPSQSAKTTTVSKAGGTDDLSGVVLAAGLPVEEVAAVKMAPAPPRYATLVHGSVLGVPLAGPLPAVDDRPAADRLALAVGQDLDDVVSAFGASVLGLDAHHRRSAETLVAAFASGVIERLAAADGLEDLAERQHAAGFWSLPGRALAAARPDRLRAADSAPAGPLTIGRKGRAAHAAALGVAMAWKEPAARGMDVGLQAGSASGRSTRIDEADGVSAYVPPTPAGPALSREVVRPAPRYFRPQAPMVALRGAHPNHRHHGDGLHDDSGRLRCRYPGQCVTEITGVVSGAAVLPTVGSGAVPPEVLTVAREAILLNPYGYRWLAAAGTATDVNAATTRIAAEMVRLYGTDGRYDGTSHVGEGTAGADPWATAEQSIVDRDIAQELARHSLLAGTTPSPVALTTWRQPWVPLWLEWRVALDGRDSAAGWEIDGVDLRWVHPGPPADPGREVRVTFDGRSAVGPGAATALREGIRRWLEAERRRDATGGSTLPAADQNVLGRLADLIAPLDLVSASLDGIREQLLGIPYVGVIERGGGPDPKPAATGPATPLFGGRLSVIALRLVDAFGRTLEVPAAALAGAMTTLLSPPPSPLGPPPLDLAAPPRSAPGPMTHVATMIPAIQLRPRIQHLARWLFRLVDPAQPASTGADAMREAFVDQLDPGTAVNPVAGFLLPDHIDEELEAFTVAGDPIGQLGHDPVSGAVTWEPAPGRPLPPDAGPMADLEPQSRITGVIAAGLVAADVAARASAAPPAASALTALLRAIDTTLWTVDTFAAIGSPTVAGLIGRPVAIVRAMLRLDAPDDVDEVDVLAPGGADARRAAFAALAEQRFPVKLGALTRSDDALLGFYVDDDYAHLHLVDRVVAAHALESGKHRGHLGLLGTVDVPPVDPLAHPYLVPDGTIHVRIGQTVRLTLLMLPVGRVHLTSGLLPRKALALSDSWVTPGLRRLVPSVRVGPVLVNPDEIRLPLVSLLGDSQTFTRRTGPLTWRDDPILAATQTAYLPRLPHEVQEGWVRVSPKEPEPPAGEDQA